MLPPSIEITEGGQGKTYDIVGPGGNTEETRAGEVNVIKNPKLREVSFSSVFPAQYYPFVSQDFPVFVPMYYIEHIQRWKDAKYPIRFIFAGNYNSFTKSQDIKNRVDINIPASIESFTWSEQAGSPGDIEYKLNLKEYVFYSPRKVVSYINTDGETEQKLEPPKRPDERLRPDTYALKPGYRTYEALMEAGKRWYGTDAVWRELAAANGIPEHELLEPSDNRVIKLPKTFSKLKVN
ncbi:peptidoglycan-binding protein LysM [Paenibacillus ginsengarvi]|uniref:Peptidoglycan-binding protein LysM n=1 Tax=Paenibacillus ginsengarvi TaxID=400777 RepID=A0A3B0CSI9_9BACL|nr:peptidoglycan-binding protein LysM [Paenibacillus ginsengarvi]RKN85866.1 peptidoglycan-binding protein LysM [Paenibacillus ginsengarvi]